MRDFLQKPKNILLGTVILSLIPLIAIVYKIWSGEFALWYDPARDLLSGLTNLQKPTLIGPTTGIPGVFYGPYWIWLLSFGELFSRNPRIVAFVVETIPYTILFPYILFQFRKVINLSTLALLWLAFLLSFNNYFTDLWNPHLAPLLILLTVYLHMIETKEFSIKDFFITFCAGFVAGLTMNFQLSLGIGMMLGLIIFRVGESIVVINRAKKKASEILKRIVFLGLFFFGAIFSFLPFLLFELRHQFLQTKTLLNALLHYGGVVNISGLSKPEIVHSFFATAAQLLQLPFVLASMVLIYLVIFYSYTYRLRKDKERKQEIKLLTLLGSIVFGIGYIYLTARNPVWSYHFIGVEIFFLLFLGVLINRQKLSKIALAIWILFLLVRALFSTITSFNKPHPLIAGTLIAEEAIVNKINQESRGREYTVFAYSPSIYTFEYAYLFQTMSHKDVPYRPELNPQNSNLVFIVIPAQTTAVKKTDFIHFRTPDKEYMTSSQWLMRDGTQILERKKIHK